MVRKLWLHNFRNYSDIELNFQARQVAFIGKNGQGKSNLIEALFFLSMLRSFRTTRLQDIIKIGSDGFMLGLEYDENSWQKQLTVDCHNGKRILKIDGETIYRSSDFIRNLKAVVFSPLDIEIVTGRSGVRRRFIDMLISINEPSYMMALHNYNQALRSRNMILKRPNRDSNLIKAYEPILAQLSAEIIRQRMQYAELLENEIEKLLGYFFKGGGLFRCFYKNNSGTTEPDELLNNFQRNRQREQQRGFTVSGPHLDDFELYFKDIKLRYFGSTGQCRLIALCLKLARINLLLQYIGKSSEIIALVDDVTGNLDNEVKELFMEIIGKVGQIFYTFTESAPIKLLKGECEMFKVDSGRVFSGIL